MGLSSPLTILSHPCIPLRVDSWYVEKSASDLAVCILHVALKADIVYDMHYVLTCYPCVIAMQYHVIVRLSGQAYVDMLVSIGRFVSIYRINLEC